jgi:hypothetical protein
VERGKLVFPARQRGSGKPEGHQSPGQRLGPFGRDEDVEVAGVPRAGKQDPGELERAELQERDGDVEGTRDRRHIARELGEPQVSGQRAAAREGELGRRRSPRGESRREVEVVREVSPLRGWSSLGAARPEGPP